MTDLSRHLVALLSRTGRAYPALQRELESLSRDAQQDLIRLLREGQADVDSMKRKARMGFLPY